MAANYSTIEQALEELRAGHLIMVIDDPDRENEGDLICAAQFATTQNVNFMAAKAKGLICTPMSEQVAKHLGLEQMVKVNTDNHHTAFTVSTPRPAFPQRSAASPAASASTRTPGRRICAVRVTYSRSSRAAAAC